MSNLSNHDPIVPQDLGLDDADVNDLGLPEALSQDEIEDLIHSPTISAGDRLARLVEIREHLTMRAASEFGDNDVRSLLGEVERAIDGLSGEIEARSGDADGAVPYDVEMVIDPTDHRETLAPDDDELLDLLEEEEDEDEDEAELLADEGDEDDDEEEVLDPEEWEDGDGFDTGKGVH